MKTIFALASLMVILAAVLSGSAGLAKGTSSIQGTVVDSKHDQPMMSVVVTLYPSHGQKPVATIQTARDGTFRLQGLAGGDYRLFAAKSGYRSVEVSGLTVAPSEHLIIGFPVTMAIAPAGAPDPIMMLARCGNLVNPNETADVYVTCSGPR